MICKKCNNTFANTAKFCPKCGTKAENQVAVQDTKMKKCPKCGAENLFSAKFCKVDGYNFQLAEEKAKASIVDANKEPDKVLCPKCGAAYDFGVKFCKKDGTSLQKDDVVKETAVIPETRSETKEISAMSQHSVTSSVVSQKNSPVKETSPAPEIKSETKQATAIPQRSTDNTAATKGLNSKPTVLPTNDKKIEQPRSEKAGGHKTTKIIIAAVVLVLLSIAGVGSYLFFTGYIGNNPDKIAAKINDELKGKGLSISCEIDKNWTATLKGAIRNAADKDVATGIVNAHKEVKDLKYDMQMPLSPSEVAVAIDNALRDGGFSNIRAEVDDNLTATLQGVANNENEKESAIKIAAGLGKAKDVKDNIQIQAVRPQPVAPAKRPIVKPPIVKPTSKPHPSPQPAPPDPAKIEGELNRALRNAGLRGITAEVGDDLSATLKGSIGSAEDKNRAFEIAKTFNSIRKVRDRIFVVK